MKKWKKITAALMAVVLAAGFVGCGSTETTEQKEATESQNETAETENSSEKSEAADHAGLKELRIGVAGTDGSYTMELANVANDNGALEEELKNVGYQLTIVTFAGAGPEINEAFAAGEIDGAVYGDFPAFVSKSNGIDTTIVATVNGKMQYGVLAANDTITTAKDLEGKKVIVPQGTTSSYFWESYVKANGLDASKIEIINALADANSLLQSGDADAIVSTLYMLYYYEELGLGTVFDDGSTVTDGFTTTVFEVSTALLNDDPAIGVAINKALIRAYEESVKNPQVLYDALESANVSADIYEKVFSFDPSLEYMSPELTDDLVAYYKNLNNWLKEHSMISEDIDIDSFIGTDYYQQAASELQ